MKPNPAPVLDLIEAFRRSKTMFAACDLGVFDKLADGPQTAESLGEGCNVDAMSRLLDACVGLGLLTRVGLEYSNTPVAQTYLRRKSPDTLYGYIAFSNNVLYPLFEHLEDAVREGTHRWKQAFHADGPIFSSLYRTPEDRKDFLLGMHGMGMLSSPHVVAAFDLSGFRKLVDLGGGTGHLAMAAAKQFPNLKTAVFDLKDALESTKEFVAGTDVELIAGDFFVDPLPQADLYSLGRILHDWQDEKVRLLLKRVYESLPSGGALLIAEKLISEERDGPVRAQMQSLSMLVITEGRERTLCEYQYLLEEAGFRDVQGQPTESVVDAIFARKP